MIGNEEGRQFLQAIETHRLLLVSLPWHLLKQTVVTEAVVVPFAHGRRES